MFEAKKYTEHITLCIFCYFYVTIQEPLFREVFWHVYAKIPRVASQNPITNGDFYWILARNCEGTEQLHFYYFLII